MAVTVYIHDNKVVKYQNKVCIARSAAFSVEVTTTTDPQDFTLYLAGASSLRITWGDTSEDTYTGSDGLKTHSYATAGTYIVTFVSGTADRIAFGESGCTPRRLTSLVTPVADWLNLTSSAFMFSGCTKLYNTGWCAKFFDDASAAITDMSYMFEYCEDFDQPVSGWNTAKVTNMTNMFFTCYAFNQSVSNFDTSLVTDMSYMFFECLAFNQSVSSFDTSLVTNMSDMFQGCYVFNQSVSSFDTSLVTDMSSMFAECFEFNQSVSSFDTSLVTDMSGMFADCSVFDQDLSDWNVTELLNADNMLSGTSFSQTNYDLLLVDWAAQAVQSSVPFHAGDAHYSAGAPTTAHDYLTGTKLWTITDGGTP